MQIKTEKITRHKIEDINHNNKEYAIQLINHEGCGYEYEVYEKTFCDCGGAESGPKINVDWKFVAKGGIVGICPPTNENEAIELLQLLLNDFEMNKGQDLAIRTLESVEKFLSDEEKFDDVIDHDKDCWENPGCILCEVRQALKELKGE